MSSLQSVDSSAESRRKPGTDALILASLEDICQHIRAGNKQISECIARLESMEALAVAAARCLAAFAGKGAAVRFELSDEHGNRTLVDGRLRVVLIDEVRAFLMNMENGDLDAFLAAIDLAHNGEEVAE